MGCSIWQTIKEFASRHAYLLAAVCCFATMAIIIGVSLQLFSAGSAGEKVALIIALVAASILGLLFVYYMFHKWCGSSSGGDAESGDASPGANVSTTLSNTLIPFTSKSAPLTTIVS